MKKDSNYELCYQLDYDNFEFDYNNENKILNAKT